MIWEIIPGYSLYKMLFYKIKYSGNKIGYKARIGLNTVFEGSNEVLAYSYFCGEMGYGSYIGPYCNITARIGRFCSIAPSVKVVSGVHPIKAPFATTSPYFYSNRFASSSFSFSSGTEIFEEFRFADKNKKYDVEIGSDCWIGENVLLISGVHLGNGSVVLAGAVVTKDVPSYAIVGGVPAKVVSYRYDEETIRWLNNNDIWNRPIDWIKTNWKLFNNIELLKIALF